MLNAVDHENGSELDVYIKKVRLPYPDRLLLLACYAKGVIFACAWHGIYLSWLECLVYNGKLLRILTSPKGG